jgi:Glycosyltransferases involved in cell wall biogenesis
MISVVTMTYQRHHILEEAIESFLRQDFSGESEMLVLNDSPKVEYVFEHPKVRIFNMKERLPSEGHKLKFGFSECKYDHIYRLDDDDLLAPWALKNTWDDIINHPDYEIYRSDGHYLFENNKFLRLSGCVNNGNVYTKKYLSRIEIPLNSTNEDYILTYNYNAKIYESNREQKTMLYRWGMNTYHLSGMGSISDEAKWEWTDRIIEEKGVEEGIIELHPHFDEDYYQQISK